MEARDFGRVRLHSYIDHYDFTEKEVRILHPITVWMAFLLLFTFVASLCIATVHLAIGLIGIVATAMLSNLTNTHGQARGVAVIL